MQKLRDTLEQYGRWQELRFLVDRMEAYLETDFSTALENAKSLLESIGKQICESKGVALEPSSSINGVLKRAFVALGYSGDDMVRQVSSALATIGQQVGELRNQISPTSHGKPLEELRNRNDKVDLLTREFLIDSTLVVAVFLIRAFETRQIAGAPVEAAAEAAEPLRYEDNSEFNDYWDETIGDVVMGDAYSYPASEVLFAVDAQAYAAECKAYAESSADEDPGEGE
ncbi:MAG: abortive infection family protein [Burkholderiales bacterium]|nr:abortive infection family protein [Burkholderiales bacterium]